jgi:hypothetical protein
MNLFEIVYEKDYLTPPSWHVFDIKVKIINYVLERMEFQKELIKNIYGKTSSQNQNIYVSLKIKISKKLNYETWCS